MPVDTKQTTMSKPHPLSPAAEPAAEPAPLPAGELALPACASGAGGLVAALHAPTALLAAATADDVDAIWQLEQAAYPLPWSRASLADVVAHQGTSCGEYVVQLLWEQTWEHMREQAQKQTQEQTAAPTAASQPPIAHKALQGYFVAMLGFEEMHLLNLAVHPAFQGRGCGLLLLQHLQNWARWCGARTLWLEVRQSNLRAHALYRRFGFTDVALRQNYYPTPSGGREHAVVMQLPLET